MPKLSERSQNLILAIGATLLTGAVYLPFASLGVDPHHDGIMLKSALDFAAGQLPYRDFFNQYGLLSIVIQAFALETVSVKLLTLKQLTVLFYALSAGLLASCWRRILPPGLTLLSLFIWLNFAYFYQAELILLPWSSVYSLFFHVLAIFFFLNSLKRGRFELGFAFLAGLSVSAAYWCRQPVGILLLGAGVGSYTLVPFLRKDSSKLRYILRMNVAFLAGLLPLSLLFLNYLTQHQIIQEWYYQNHVWPAHWVKPHMSFRSIRQRILLSPNHAIGLFALFVAAALPLRRWILRFEGKISRIPRHEILAYGLVSALAMAWAIGWPSGFLGTLLEVDRGWAALVPVCCSVGVSWLLLKRTKELGPGIPGALVVILLFSLASWPQYFPVSDPRHVYWGITPFIGLFVFLANRVLKERATWVAALILPFLLPMTGIRAVRTLKKLSTNDAVLSRPALLEGMKVPGQTARLYEDVYTVMSGYFQSNGAHPTVMESRDALFGTFTSDLRNPGPYFVYWWEFACPEIDQARARFIRQEKPMVIIEGDRRPGLDQLLTGLKYRTLWNSADKHWEITVPQDTAAALPEAK